MRADQAQPGDQLTYAGNRITIAATEPAILLTTTDGITLNLAPDTELDPAPLTLAEQIAELIANPPADPADYPTALQAILDAAP